MFPLFSHPTSASNHFLRWDSKPDKALFPPDITTLYSYPICVQDSEEEPQKSKTRVLSCGCLRQAGSSQTIPS